eukprot:COSAG02_NODE_888_length_16167_cov_293.783234_2_plen_92_part_00
MNSHPARAVKQVPACQLTGHKGHRDVLRLTRSDEDLLKCNQLSHWNVSTDVCWCGGKIRGMVEDEATGIYSTEPTSEQWWCQHGKEVIDGC